MPIEIHGLLIILRLLESMFISTSSLIFLTRFSKFNSRSTLSPMTLARQPTGQSPPNSHGPHARSRRTYDRHVDDSVTLATSSSIMYKADKLAMLRKNQNEWKRNQHKSNDLRGRKTGQCHGVSDYRYTTEILSSQSEDAHATLKPVHTRSNHHRIQ